jgi:hypothetical protein
MPLSSITKLPVATRSRWLKKISANANAAGGSKRQTNGRPRKDAMARMAGILGIYPIEFNKTGALAASVGGSSPATIAATGGTPATTVIATSELDPITWAAPGTKALSVSAPAGMYGEADGTL